MSAPAPPREPSTPVSRELLIGSLVSALEDHGVLRLRTSLPKLAALGRQETSDLQRLHGVLVLLEGQEIPSLRRALIAQARELLEEFGIQLRS